MIEKYNNGKITQTGNGFVFKDGKFEHGPFPTVEHIYRRWPQIQESEDMPSEWQPKKIIKKAVPKKIKVKSKENKK